MAGEPDDPARAARATLNMTPMIDVVFQLMVVFLCAMKFRTLDEKIEAHLPKRESVDPRPVRDPPPVETTLRLRLRRPSPADPTSVLVLGERWGSTVDGEALWVRLRERIAAVRARAPDLVGEIDADPDVEHGEVVRALDCFGGAGVERVRFRGTGMK